MICLSRNSHAGLKNKSRKVKTGISSISFLCTLVPRTLLIPTCCSAVGSQLHTPPPKHLNVCIETFKDNLKSHKCSRVQSTSKALSSNDSMLNMKTFIFYTHSLNT